MARLYPLLLGSRYDELAPLLREVHERANLLRGKVTVTLGANPLSRLLAKLAGMPASCSDASCEVRFEHPPGLAAGAERWVRNMAGSRFSSLLVAAAPAEFRESFGWYRFRFALAIDNGAVEFTLRGWSVLGVPMPRVLWPRISTRESQQGGEYLFAVRVELPLLGLLVDYRGRLRVVEARA
ncbi:MAG: saccharopine dehydrogenase [Betaproteobacteria bacterium]|nr:saccharopine dehydrogenase [Betaproteobacteria bacterium]